jgi:hypothetical protein
MSAHPPAEIAAAMVAAYSDRYERTGPLEEPIYACLAAALRVLPPDADLAAVIYALDDQP